MSCAADPAKNMGSSTGCETLRVVNTTPLSVCSSGNVNSIGHVTASVGFQETKVNREHMVGIAFGNMFAKKIDLRDNFFGFNEFLNKCKDFLHIMKDVGTELESGEKVRLYGRV
jgi:hypothetical protein